MRLGFAIREIAEAHQKRNPEGDALRCAFCRHGGQVSAEKG